MTTDETIKKAGRLLWDFYQTTGTSKFTIRGDILRADDLDNDVFWTFACPKLLRDGVLTEIPKNIIEDTPTLKSKKITMYKRHRAILFSVDRDKLLELINSRERPIDTGSLKIEIYINRKRGIYLADNADIAYPISRKRFAIIKKLLEDDIVPISTLEDLTAWDKSDISRTISKINKSFAKKLKVQNKLILHLDTGGYSLNREHFNIESDI